MKEIMIHKRYEHFCIFICQIKPAVQQSKYYLNIMRFVDNMMTIYICIFLFFFATFFYWPKNWYDFTKTQELLPLRMNYEAHLFLLFQFLCKKSLTIKNVVCISQTCSKSDALVIIKLFKLKTCTLQQSNLFKVICHM